MANTAIWAARGAIRPLPGSARIWMRSAWRTATDNFSTGNAVDVIALANPAIPTDIAPTEDRAAQDGY